MRRSLSGVSLHALAFGLQRVEDAGALEQHGRCPAPGVVPERARPRRPCGVEVLDIIGCFLGLRCRLHEQGRVVAQDRIQLWRYAALLSRVVLAMPQTPQRYAAPISATSSSFA